MKFIHCIGGVVTPWGFLSVVPTFLSIFTLLCFLSICTVACNVCSALTVRLSSSSPAVRPLNPRLEVDLRELSVMQCLEDLTLIDVRQPAELHSQEQIPGSLNIPRKFHG